MTEPLATPQATRGDRAADWLARKIGWPYLIAQNGFIFSWMGLNSMLGLSAPDPYPYILLNLVLSFQAAQTGPIILIAGRRQEMLQRLLLRQMYDTMQAVKSMIAVILQHTERATAADDRAAKRDAKVIAVLAAQNDILKAQTRALDEHARRLANIEAALSPADGT